jgi:hypothetical protein
MRLLWLSTILTATIVAQDPVKEFCRRHQHQTCVIDSKLYIDGGKVHYGSSVQNDSIAEQSELMLSDFVYNTD